MALKKSESRPGTDSPKRQVSTTQRCDLASTLDAMTHAVVNALHTVTAASELAELLIARKATAEATEPLGRVESECIRAARLLRDGRELLTFGPGSAEEVVDVAALLATCAGAFADGVDVSVDGQLPVVHGDVAMLRRAFMEILANAFQFGGHHVKVELKRRHPDAGIRVSFRDDGRGVAASATRIFEPFFSTVPDAHSGLGLAFAVRAVAAHGGSIDLVPAASGATFQIDLPTRRA